MSSTERLFRRAADCCSWGTQLMASACFSLWATGCIIGAAKAPAMAIVVGVGAGVAACVACRLAEVHACDF
eukprot:4781293-Amphidinium_carterae.1